MKLRVVSFAILVASTPLAASGWALPAGQSLTAGGVTFEGVTGVAPGWGVDGARCDGTCQQWVSACVISRINFLGVHVELSQRGDSAAPSPG